MKYLGGWLIWGAMWAAWVVLGALAGAQPETSIPSRIPACLRRGSGAYCSVGRTRGYVGPLDTAQQLKEALEATAFNKEVIIFAETRLADAAQMLARTRGGAGYAHVLAVLTEHRDCQRLARVMSPWQHEQGPLSCGSYATADERGEPYESGFFYFRRPTGMIAWWRKWFTVARSVALGFNVMAVDSDTVALDDWYWRAKQPPLSQYTLLSQAECPICINGGFSYIQNANPAGPVAWLLYEAVHRAVRWTEDWSVMSAISPSCAAYPGRVGWVDDQSMLSDTMWNCVVGRPQFLALWYFIRDDPRALKLLQVASESEFRERNTPAANFTDEVYPVGGELAAAVCELFGDAPFNCTQPAATATIRTATLRMPHSGGMWPLQGGGYPFGRTPGPRTEAYRLAFKELGVALPPDPEDPATETQARATKTELFGLLSMFGDNVRHTGAWAESVWFHAGRLGYWHTHLGPPPVQAVGHTHATLFPGDFQKQVIMQTSGHHDWKVAARLGGGPSRAFFASYRHQEAFANADQDNMTDISRVVAYGKGVIGPGMTKAQFLSAVRGLAQVAVALGAVAAWPAVPCEAEWVLSKAQQGLNTSRPVTRHTIPWLHLNTQYVVLPFGDSLDDLQCEWTGFASVDCLMDRQQYGEESGRGLLAVEFHHLTRRRELAVRRPPLPVPQSSLVSLGAGAAKHQEQWGRHVIKGASQPLQGAPEGEYTIRLAEAGPAAGAVPNDDGSCLFNTSFADLMRLNPLLAQLRKQPRKPIPVLWLDRPVGQVTDLEGDAATKYEWWRRRCRALSYDLQGQPSF